MKELLSEVKFGKTKVKTDPIKHMLKLVSSNDSGKPLKKDLQFWKAKEDKLNVTKSKEHAKRKKK